MVIPQLKLLINLAQVDGVVVEKEIKFITNIGLANNIPVADIMPLFAQQHELIVPANLSEKERFEFIFSLVQLMKIDEKLYQEEIRFCSKVASKLGYDQSVMFDLMLHVRTVMEANELDSLKKLTAKYLK
jgi:hypothetical protein